MRHPDGGFFSSQDADSEGVEGKVFRWTWDELMGVADEHVATCLGAAPDGNWEGTNVLWRPLSPGAVAAEEGIDADDLEARVGRALRMLFQIREGRVRPGTDDKVLAGWNGLV